MADIEYTDIQKHQPRRAGIVVSVRLKPDEAQLLHALADRDGRSLSETLRVGLHALAQRPIADVVTLGEAHSPTRGGILETEDSLTFSFS